MPFCSQLFWPVFVFWGFYYSGHHISTVAWQNTNSKTAQLSSFIQCGLYIALRCILNVYEECVHFKLQRWQLKLTEFMFADPWSFLAAWPTFFPPALRPSWPCFSQCGRIRLASSYIAFLGTAPHFSEKIILLFTMAPTLMHSHTAAHTQHTACGSGSDPVVNRACARAQSFCMSRITCESYNSQKSLSG